MGTVIACIPADDVGNKLWIKDFGIDGDKMFVNYRSTYNDIPFMETQVFMIDQDTMVITADNGTVMYRFSKDWIEKIK